MEKFELLCYDCGERYTPGESGNCPTCLADKTPAPKTVSKPKAVKPKAGK